ncbi:7527_t:CDS:2 [Cetraspora pellucida]|uniref:7527_t:CDS:1 n=1 Tax=Cetraspora pellucida TaxID=1433469 RepID=A0A9N9DQR5_9GLOM|nr:7527_t:CDS:2 [Cetraspora pellucida]
MSSLLGLNYYDDDEDDQQAENDMVTVEQSNNILGKHFSPSPSVFSNLIRRRGNNTISQKPRYEESTSPKVTGNTLPPQSDTVNCPDKQEKHISDDNPIIPNEQISTDDSEDVRQHSAMRQLLTPKPIEGRENWGIPPEPETECDPILQEKIDHFHSLSKKGVHFNENLLKNKAFRNPHIYNKLVEFVELDEIGSNFDREIFDPYGFPSEAFADQLAEAQKKILEERAAAQQQQRSQIQFVGSSPGSQNISKSRHVMQSLAARAERGSTTANNTTVTKSTVVTNSITTSSKSSSSTGRKRASKWDVPAPNVALPPSSSSTTSSSRHNSNRTKMFDILQSFFRNYFV